ncbi:MAG TPA: MFS transporter [Anaerolineae bacterium]|nr:MFS transporter [Anaerolineae bacterium]
MRTKFSAAPRVPLNTLWKATARGFEALQVRNYRLFWFSQLISLTGSWMQSTAQAWLVLKLTNDSPFALGVVVTLQFFPVMLFALFGGVLADHLPKRTTLIVTQSLLLIQAAIFGGLVATGAIQLWHVYVLAMTQGLITAIDNPVRQAFLFEMVGRDVLVNAIGLNSMSFQVTRIFGPAVAGIVIQLVGFAPTLFLNAFSFVPVIGALLLMDASKLFAAPATGEASMLERLREGLRFARRTPSILSILIVAAFIGTFGINFSVFTPLIADNVLKTDASGFGLLSAAVGVGALFAALGTAYMRRVTMRRLLVSGALFSIFLGTLALSTTLWVSILLFVIVGFTGIAWATTTNSLLQLETPEQLRGRVLSINVLLTIGSTPIGGFFIGSVAQVAGVETAMLICTLLCLVGVGIAVLYRWRVAQMSPETRPARVA